MPDSNRPHPPAAERQVPRAGRANGRCQRSPRRPRAAPSRHVLSPLASSPKLLRTRVSVRLGGHSPVLLLTRAQGAQLLQGAVWAPGWASGAGVGRPGTPLRLCPHSPLRQRGGTDRPPREAVPHRCRARRAETRSWGRWGSCRAPLQNPPLPIAARAHLRLRVRECPLSPRNDAPQHLCKGTALPALPNSRVTPSPPRRSPCSGTPHRHGLPVPCGFFLGSPRLPHPHRTLQSLRRG